MCSVGKIVILIIIMMDIDDDIEVFIKGVIDYFYHTIHPRFIYRKGGIHMVVPGDRDTDNVNTGGLEAGHHRPGCTRPSPAGFGR